MFYYFLPKDLQILQKTAEHMKHKKILPYEVAILESNGDAMSITVFCPNIYVEDFINYMKMTYKIKPTSYSL